MRAGGCPRPLPIARRGGRGGTEAGLSRGRAGEEKHRMDVTGVVMGPG